MRLFPLLVLYAACVLLLACGKTTSDADATGGASGGEGGGQEKLIEIACSTEQACVLDENGALTCWGDLKNGGPPKGNFVALVGNSTLSALSSDGEVVTWGSTGCPDGQDCLANLPGPHAAVFEGLRQIRYYLDADGRVSSSRDNWTGDRGPNPILPDARPKESFVSLAAGFFVCGLRADGSFLCWGDKGLGTPPVDDGQHTYSELDSKSGGLCGITREDGSLVCFGSTYDGPTGKGYRAVVRYSQSPPGDTRRCGLTAAGDLDCSTSPHEQMVPAGASLDKVCAGQEFVCGIRFDGKVSCWGRENGNFTDDPLILRIPESIAAK